MPRDVKEGFSKETIGDIIDRMCTKYENNEAIVCTDKNVRYSYRDFKKMYDGIAKGLLKLGIKKGDHLSIWSLNSPEWIALQIATAKIGAVLVCINSDYSKHELEYALKHSNSKVLFFSKGYNGNNYADSVYSICPELKICSPGELSSKAFPDMKRVISLDGEDKNSMSLENLIEMGKDVSDEELLEKRNSLECHDTTNIQYTSGTTGNPKAVMSTHYSIINNAFVSGKNLDYSEKDRLLVCLPLFHVMGCVLSVVQCLLYGAAIVLVDRFQTTKVLEYLDKEKCTGLNGVPTMFQFLLSHPNFDSFALSNLRKGMIAGSYCHPGLMNEIMDKMHMKELCIVYGLTEAMGITQTLTSDPLYMRINTVGRGMFGTEIKIINPATGKEVPNGVEGELVAKTEYIMKGYYKNQEATQKIIDKDGWLHTGDLAIKDDEGYCKVVGRIKDIIIRGGENISPTEIEELLVTHVSIKEAAVIGVPDKNLGEEICAFIIINDKHTLSKEDVISFIQDRLAKFKIPKYIEFVKEFPTTASGKIKKFMLKEYAIEKYRK
ncbi:MAG TPA: AMP-binding protein [Clostridia bacterium]|nr:AMP-binding protein [Clostridia bacterium]